MSSTDRPLLGIALNLAGLVVFAVQDVIIKLLSGEYSAFQIVFIRSLVAFVPIITVIYVTLGMRGFVTRRLPALLLRSVLLFISYTSYYLAVAAMPLVDVVSIVFAAPLFVTALSMPLLKESVGVRRWAGVGMGFVGVLIMVRPTGAMFQVASLLALIAAVTYALSIIITRRVGATESGWTMSFYATCVFAMCSGVGAGLLGALDLEISTHASYAFLVRAWVWPDTAHLGLMVGLGFIAAIGFFCLTQAYRIAPVSIVAPFDYSYFLWAAVLGYLFWGDLPSSSTLVGVTVVVLSGLYILHREVRLARQRRSEKPLQVSIDAHTSDLPRTHTDKPCIFPLSAKTGDPHRP